MNDADILLYQLIDTGLSELISKISNRTYRIPIILKNLFVLENPCVNQLFFKGPVLQIQYAAEGFSSSILPDRKSFLSGKKNSDT